MTGAIPMTGDWTTGEPILLAQRCAAGHRWYLPRARCPVCSEAVESFEPTGAGTVFAETSLHRRSSGRDTEAVGIALIDLDDGVRLMARCRPGTRIGTRVHVSIVFDEGSQRLLPSAEEVAA
ncbi:OB-fold domain-containing protein [Herbiconiux sp. CPCC 203407]|uniref:OB-fold domain-containing protein n=1 Tax=Herbiconiux oxytropis TaxID=2970915 RepID=A0AA42BX03_9MICO|nr:OB-fold domain-containing protein [Herbiconiux oxytropis]MCS5722848.1 OB-fold domain-containing protein [Herbiconiux oxytropis]MCS5727778.1 OB-fold domain-containing protein [Herbiconiux oxytropis]